MKHLALLATLLLLGCAGPEVLNGGGQDATVTLIYPTWEQVPLRIASGTHIPIKSRLVGLRVQFGNGPTRTYSEREITNLESGRLLGTGFLVVTPSGIRYD